MKKAVLSQFIVLLIGTLFAWGNFAVELNETVSYPIEISAPKPCVYTHLSPKLICGWLQFRW